MKRAEPHAPTGDMDGRLRYRYVHASSTWANCPTHVHILLRDSNFEFSRKESLAKRKSGPEEH